MKLTAVLLFITCLQVSANIYSQTVTLNVQNAPLEKVLKEIEKQSKYNFFYEEGLFHNAKPITVSVSNITLEQVLEVCFKEQPFEYKVVKNTVFVKRRELVKAEQQRMVLQSQGELKGHVGNDKGESLEGANITVKRSGKGTITDANGNFTLSAINSDDIIIISFIGYQILTIKVGENVSLSIILKEASNELDRVIMQAYGTTTKRLSTGNISKVTSEEIQQQPVANALQALQGRVAGLSVSQTSGFSSAPFKVEIRGRNSISGLFTGEPLYIIDGVPLTVLETGGASNYYNGSTGFIQNPLLLGPAGGQSPLFSLNPNEIESIEVLKDADATSIYGSRGANGVILITTKRGAAGKTSIDIRLSQGISKVARFWNYMNTPQYLQMRREGFMNDGTIPDAGSAPDLLVWDTTKHTDWQKQIWGKTGSNTSAQAAISGGNQQTNFRLSFDYTGITNVLTASGKDQRESIGFNFNHSPSARFHIAFGANYSFTRSDMINLPSNIAALAPNTPSIYDSSGKLNYSAWEPVRPYFPFAFLLQPYSSKTHFLNSNFVANYNILKGLNFKISAGFNSATNSQSKLTPISSLDPSYPQTGSAQFGNNFNRGWIIEPQIAYNLYMGRGRLSVLIGGSYQYSNTEANYAGGTGYTSDALLKSVSNAPVKYASENFGEYKYAALFSRISYNWDNKYFININGRRDGSSRFGEGNQFGNFGSVGLGWVFSQENFVRNKIGFLSFGKLRGSYGTTGSDAVGDYQYITRWGNNSSTIYNGYASLAPTQHANPNFKWQANRKLEIGSDFGFFRDRITLSIAYYDNRCSNQLVNTVLPVYTGFDHVIANWPAKVQNSGLEITTSGKVLETKNLSWSLFFNIALNRNKLLDFPNLEQTAYAHDLIIGKSLNLRNILHYTGVDPQTGLYTFNDRNQDGVITPFASLPENDAYPLELNPKYSGGFGTTLKYKQWQLGFNFNYIKQIGLNGLTLTNAQGAFSAAFSNLPVEFLGRWKKSDDISGIARFSAQGIDESYANYYSRSDGVYSDASYIRLANCSLSYSLPVGMIKNTGFKSVGFFINAQNLFTITKYKGLDPETRSPSTLPTLKVIVAGISLNL
ncbi:hypothetical protein A4H97_21080 [Niastella yeongjuensis]|uniref:TonB-dependent receptor plug domain-containing protein n=1 Tax=Niastella yeongjuensis TaxID=354355 RepID=A0A1V9FCH2_9BACT|nr:SusC/RagA family TonB-linked outer membrane protein [Niastella yeongjuensis]OQP56074.1 hypothetical protein A4H97_21080 [Niastella yeongjuensis]